MRAIITRHPDLVVTQAENVVFELVTALGMDRIGPTRPWSVPVLDWPFSSFAARIGVASIARRRESDRQEDLLDGVEPPPPQQWEAPARALEKEMWASLYRTGVDAVALARQALQVEAAYDARKDPEDEEWPPRLSESDEAQLAEFASRLTQGLPSARPSEIESRREADARATVPPAEFG